MRPGCCEDWDSKKYRISFLDHSIFLIDIKNKKTARFLTWVRGEVRGVVVKGKEVSMAAD